MKTIDYIIKAARNREQNGRSRPPDREDDVSGMCFILQLLLENGIPVKGFTTNEPDAGLPVLHKDPISGSYEVRMHDSGAERRQDFAIMVLAITECPEFLVEVYNPCSSPEDLFDKRADLLTYYNEILSIL